MHACHTCMSCMHDICEAWRAHNRAVPKCPNSLTIRLIAASTDVSLVLSSFVNFSVTFGGEWATRSAGLCIASKPKTDLRPVPQRMGSRPSTNAKLLGINFKNRKWRIVVTCKIEKHMWWLFEERNKQWELSDRVLVRPRPRPAPHVIQIAFLFFV